MTQQQHLTVIRFIDGQLWQCSAGDAEPRRIERLEDSHRHAIFAAPAEATRLVNLSVAPDERRHLAKSLPFTLEEHVIDPVEDMHFAYRLLSDDHYSIGIVASEVMAQWLAILGPSFEGPVMPEALLLPWQPGEACLVMEEDTVLIRYGNTLGARIDRELLVLFLSSFVTEFHSLVVYGESQEADLASLGDDWLARAQWRRGGFASALMLAPPVEGLLDLRQGQFAAALPLGRWWQHWRTVAIAASIAVILQLGADITEYQRLSAENQQIREAIQASYRQANPRGAVVDPERQLDQQLSEFAARGQGVMFTPILAKVTESVAAMSQASISTLNFSGNTAELRMDILAKDYQAVDSLRATLTERGMKATLETSSSQGSKVRARLRVAAL